VQTYQVNEQDFWLEKPTMMGLRGWSLLIPAAASSIGFFCFAVLAFSFTELSTLPADFRMALVLVGSFSLAFGSEVGTLSSVVEIYRKGERLGVGTNWRCSFRFCPPSARSSWPLRRC
jgi:hypothetical protein